MEIGIAQAILRQLVDVGRLYALAVKAELPKANIVDYDVQQVGSPLGSANRLRPGSLGLTDHAPNYFLKAWLYRHGGNGPSVTGPARLAAFVLILAAGRFGIDAGSPGSQTDP
jgi:hypothetical protein